MDEKVSGASSTPEDDFNAASDAALADSNVAEYTRLENERELAAAAGKALPEVPPPSKTDKPADSKPAATENTGEKKAPVKDADSRKAELNAEIQDLLKRRAELRTEVDKPTDKTTDKPGDKAAPPPAPVKAAEIGERPKKPSINDFRTFEEFDAANDKYVVELVKFEARDLAANERTAAAEAKAQADRDAYQAEWEEQKLAAIADMPDFEAVALNPKLPISVPMFHAMRATANTAKLLYHLGQHPDLAAEIAALHPLASAARIGKLDARLFPEGGEEKKAAPVKKFTAAPRPATDLAAKDSEGQDPVEAALARGDVETYIRLANDRDAKAARR